MPKELLLNLIFIPTSLCSKQITFDEFNRPANASEGHNLQSGGDSNEGK